jgi:hypothetical protein
LGVRSCLARETGRAREFGPGGGLGGRAAVAGKHTSSAVRNLSARGRIRAIRETDGNALRARARGWAQNNSPSRNPTTAPEIAAVHRSKRGVGLIPVSSFGCSIGINPHSFVMPPPANKEKLGRKE